MNKCFNVTYIVGLSAISSAIAMPAFAQSEFNLVYPPQNHETTADRIFLIGTAPPEGTVLVNGQEIPRSPAGHFAPSIPLELGQNRVRLRYEGQTIQRTIVRQSTQAQFPDRVGFVPGSLTPAVDIARMPGELVCFGAIATPQMDLSVQLGDRAIALMPQQYAVDLPSNLSVLTGQNQPEVNNPIGYYRGCTSFETPGRLGQPRFRLKIDDRAIVKSAPGQVEILSPTTFQIAEVIAEAGVARTGPGTSYSRLTPLPRGTQARITGKEGDWLRLDYGGWINLQEARTFIGGAPPQSMIRSIRTRLSGDWTEVLFPLQVPVPVSVRQERDRLVLTLHNTTAQTDTIAFDGNPVVSRLDWRPLIGGDRDAVEYTFHFRSDRQWGYKLRYEGTTLVMSLRHPPALEEDEEDRQPLAGMTILLDPGHGSENDLGARGPTGYPEKDVNLVVSKLLRDRLERRGATVLMTRQGDEDLWPHDRVELIQQWEPDLALSIHYNALPDAGDAMNTAGIGTFWYHPQAHDLAVFLHDYLVRELDRPSYGVFWNNLALTRPSVTPAVLLELGFMINPHEFEWIVDPQAQQQLATALADGIVAWMRSLRSG